jgi:hypothetical protein
MWSGGGVSSILLRHSISSAVHSFPVPLDVTFGLIFPLLICVVDCCGQEGVWPIAGLADAGVLGILERLGEEEEDDSNGTGRRDQGR